METIEEDRMNKGEQLKIANYAVCFLDLLGNL